MSEFQVGCTARSVIFTLSYCPECISSTILVKDGYQQCEICDAKYSLESGVAVSVVVNYRGSVRPVNRAKNLRSEASMYVEDPNEEVWAIQPHRVGKLMEWLFGLDQDTLAKAWDVCAP